MPLHHRKTSPWLLALTLVCGSVPPPAASAQAPPQPRPGVAQPLPRGSVAQPAPRGGQIERLTVARRPTLTKPFEVSSQFGDRDVFDITLGAPGQIRITTTWRGSAARLAVILNGPGQTASYARQDGASPLSLAFDVTPALFERGRVWRVSVVNFGSGQAAGRISADYPAPAPALQTLSPALRNAFEAATAKAKAPPAAPERAILPDGRVQVTYPDGRVVIHEAGCATTTIHPDGTVERSMCNQVQPATLPAVPSDPALRAFLETHRDHLLQQIGVLVDNRQPEVDLYLGYEGKNAKGLFEQIRMRTSLIYKLLLP